MFRILHELEAEDLRHLAASLAGGAMSNGPVRKELSSIAGPRSAELENCLAMMHAQGMTSAQMSLLVQAIMEGVPLRSNPADWMEVILTGPDAPGIHTGNTAAVFHTLIEKAQSEILLVGYAIHNGQRVFGNLAKRMEVNPALRVTFCIDVQRQFNDERSAEEIVSSAGRRFVETQWPGRVLPRVYYDPRSVDVIAGNRASLHAKCIVIDRQEAFVTSANFTEAAQQRNIELGLILRYSFQARRIAEYFETLIARGNFGQLPTA